MDVPMRAGNTVLGESMSLLFTSQYHCHSARWPRSASLHLAHSVDVTDC